MSRLDGRAAHAPARRIVSFGSRAGRVALQGVGYWQGRPCLVIEEGERARVLLRLDGALGADDQIVSVDMFCAGAQAIARFSERSVDLEVWGSRVWFWDVLGYDYGFQRCDYVEVAVSLSTGEQLRWRMLVRAPNRSEVHSVRRGHGNVLDLRRSSAQPGNPSPILVDPPMFDGATFSRAYIESTFGPGFGDGFGS